MNDRGDDLVRVDATGAAHPVGRMASRDMRLRRGSFRMVPAPRQLVVMRRCEDASDRDGQFWLCGEISKPGALWDLVGMIGQGNWDGELAVVDPESGSRRSVFFERGIVVGAHSNSKRERLGEVLYQYGALSREQVEIVAEALTPKVRFGEAAVGLGFLSQDKLFQIIGKQTEEIVFAAMVVAPAQFYFVEEFEESHLPYRLNLTVTSLLMEGARRMDEMECFRARIPSGMHVPERLPGAALQPDSDHYEVFEAIDGVHTVDELGRVLGRGGFETTRALFQLVQSNLVVVRPPRPTSPRAIVALFNQAISTILAEVDACGGGLEIRQQLASFATASGVYDALFRDAGPEADGTLDSTRIAETVQVILGADGTGSMLAQWLYEYAAFAMFIAEPLLRASDSADAAVVSRQVAELLKPLAPEA